MTPCTEERDISFLSVALFLCAWKSICGRDLAYFVDTRKCFGARTATTRVSRNRARNREAYENIVEVRCRYRHPAVWNRQLVMRSKDARASAQHVHDVLLFFSVCFDSGPFGLRSPTHLGCVILDYREECILAWRWKHSVIDAVLDRRCHADGRQEEQCLVLVSRDGKDSGSPAKAFFADVATHTTRLRHCDTVIHTVRR